MYFNFSESDALLIPDLLIIADQTYRYSHEIYRYY